MASRRTTPTAGLALLGMLAASAPVGADDGAIEAVGGSVAALRYHPTIAMDADPATMTFALLIVAIAAAPLLPDALRRRRARRG